MGKRYGFQLIGYPLLNSGSPQLYEKHFMDSPLAEQLEYAVVPTDDLVGWVRKSRLKGDLLGFNVTTPYKEKIINYLDDMDSLAAEINAVNTVVVKEGKWKGYNTDVYGFECALQKLKTKSGNALILGTGGAARAVARALHLKGWGFEFVSRNERHGLITYDSLTPEMLAAADLIVQATPLGSGKFSDKKPDIPYGILRPEQILIDLNYTPEKTLFLIEGLNRGCTVENGSMMLEKQAEKAWQIWCEHFPHLTVA